MANLNRCEECGGIKALPMHGGKDLACFAWSKEVKEDADQLRRLRELMECGHPLQYLYGGSGPLACALCVIDHLMKPKRFPLQSEYGNPAPLSISWATAELAYSQYSAKHGRDQSLEHLAKRGGFAPSEMDKLLPDWRMMEGFIPPAKPNPAAENRIP